MDLMDNKYFAMFIDIQQSKLLKLFKQWKIDNPKYETDGYSFKISSKYLEQNFLKWKLWRIRSSVYTSLL